MDGIVASSVNGVEYAKFEDTWSAPSSSTWSAPSSSSGVWGAPSSSVSSVPSWYGGGWGPSSYSGAFLHFPSQVPTLAGNQKVNPWADDYEADSDEA
jgi:hypothetical protein